MSKNANLTFTMMQYLTMSFVVTVVATIMTHGEMSVKTLVIGSFEGLAINIVVMKIIPVIKIATFLADSLKLKNGTFLARAFNTYIVCSILTLVISSIMVLINLGFVRNYFQIWLSAFLVLHISAFIASIIIEKPLLFLTKKIFGELP